MMNRTRLPSLAEQRRLLNAHMSDPLYRTGYLLSTGAVITALLGFVFWVIAAHLYSPHVLGLNSAAISAMLFVSSVCQLGLPAVLLRDLASTGPGAASLIRRCYALIFVTALLVGLLAALTSSVWSHNLRFLGNDLGWLVGFPLATAFYTIFQVQDSVMTALKAPQWVPLENSLFSLGKLVLLLAIAAVAPLAGPFIAWSVPAVLAAGVITWLIFGKLISARRLQDLVVHFSARRFIAMAAANNLALIFTYVVTLLMPVVVASQTSPTETAYFYVPWTISSAILLFAVNAATSLTLEASLDAPHLSSLVRRTLIHTVRLILPVVVGTVVLAPLILRLYGAQYSIHGALLLRLLAIAAIPNAAYTIGQAVLRIQHRPRALILIQAGQAVVFLGLSLLLLHSSGIIGVGIAFVVSQVLSAAILLLSTLRPHLQS